MSRKPALSEVEGNLRLLFDELLTHHASAAATIEPNHRYAPFRRLNYDLGGGGTFLPSLRALESPMAMACLGFVTVFPLRPLLSSPLFIAFISASTSFCAAGEYFRADFFAEAVLVAPFLLAVAVAIVILHHDQMAKLSRLLHGATTKMADTSRSASHGVSVSASVRLLILAVRSILSQLNGLPSMARINVLNSTMEKT
jgi:hypothetical protein